jgi:hypothetical protein
MNNPEVRGAIDRYEGDRAVVVLDDGQQLSWPRSGLPAAAGPGTAVRLSLSLATSSTDDRPSTGCAPGATPDAGAGLAADLVYNAGSGQWVLKLADESELRWPFGAGAAPQAGGPVSLRLAPDADDTAARRGRVSDLLDNILGASG